MPLHVPMQEPGEAHPPESDAASMHTAIREADEQAGALERIKASIPGLNLLTGELQDQVSRAFEAFGLWRESTDDTFIALTNLDYSASQLTPTLRGTDDAAGELADAIRDTDPELAAMLDGLEGVEGGAEDTARALDGLTGTQRAAVTAFVDGFAPMTFYEELAS